MWLSVWGRRWSYCYLTQPGPVLELLSPGKMSVASTKPSGPMEVGSRRTKIVQAFLPTGQEVMLVQCPPWGSPQVLTGHSDIRVEPGQSVFRQFRDFKVL